MTGRRSTTAFAACCACLVTESSGVLVDSSVLTSEFASFMQEHGRAYEPGSKEFERRQDIFTSNWLAVQQQNLKPNRLWTAAMNHFADWSHDELDSMKGYMKMEGKGASSSPFAALIEMHASSVPWHSPVTKHSDSMMQHSTEPSSWLQTAPREVHWTDLKSSSRVRSQRCGNCWAAATAALLEAHHELHMGEFKEVSEDLLTECTPNPFHCGGAGGCEGATPEHALEYAMKNGLPNSLTEAEDALSKCKEVGNKKHERTKALLEEPAPHEFAAGAHSALPESPARSFGLIGWQRLGENRYEDLMRALVERGPVAVAMSTDWKNDMQLYKKGIYDGCTKNALIGHSVLAVGFGEASDSAGSVNGVKYWTIQNSWGPNWGENGKIRILRDEKQESDYCGQDTQPQLGTTCDQGPSQVKVCGMCGILYDSVVPLFEAKSERSKELAKARGGGASPAASSSAPAAETPSKAEKAQATQFELADKSPYQSADAKVF
eukprot:TRINITY_DN100751_c0_g1_i1.p1 TRINITY_DN100751_c0_g1~~TRINITY_DN100751_c0_g1_i1.p1  ORF type:complete len:492 (-),score=130.80 TRINITY_DN100751_c0_g1_i1:71-1546(-)